MYTHMKSQQYQKSKPRKPHIETPHVGPPDIARKNAIPPQQQMAQVTRNREENAPQQVISTPTAQHQRAGKYSRVRIAFFAAQGHGLGWPW